MTNEDLVAYVVGVHIIDESKRVNIINYILLQRKDAERKKSVYDEIKLLEAQLKDRASQIPNGVYFLDCVIRNIDSELSLPIPYIRNIQKWCEAAYYENEVRDLFSTFKTETRRLQTEYDSIVGVSINDKTEFKTGKKNSNYKIGDIVADYANSLAQ